MCWTWSPFYQTHCAPGTGHLAGKCELRDIREVLGLAPIDEIDLLGDLYGLLKQRQRMRKFGVFFAEIKSARSGPRWHFRVRLGRRS
jgi:hypothetical protein